MSDTEKERAARIDGLKAKGIELQKALFAVKNPLDEERTKKQQALGKKKAEFKAKVAADRDEIIELHHKMIPIDEVLAAVARWKKTAEKDPDIAEASLKALTAKVEGVTNDGV